MSQGTDGRGSRDSGAAPEPSVHSPAPAGRLEPEAPAAGAPGPVVPDAAQVVFGERVVDAERFAALLSDTGVSHGLVGPREVPILWERHILNCAVAHEAFPPAVELVDVGSGAGLPGIALAIARPDLHVHLVEPMLRRTAWLTAAVEELGLDNCTVHRGRAEELAGRLSLPYATARAVARLDKLARWTFPLLADGGTLVALKGGRADEELGAATPVLHELGMTSARIRTYGESVLQVPTVTVELTVGPQRRAASARVAGARPWRPNRRPNRR